MSPGIHPGTLAGRLDSLAERLRHRSPTRLHPVSADITTHLQRLADLAAEADCQPARVLPPLPEQALGDALAVLGADLLRALPENPGPTREDIAARVSGVLSDLGRLVP